MMLPSSVKGRRYKKCNGGYLPFWAFSWQAMTYDIYFPSGCLSLEIIMPINLKVCI